MLNYTVRAAPETKTAILHCQSGVSLRGHLLLHSASLLPALRLWRKNRLVNFHSRLAHRVLPSAGIYGVPTESCLTAMCQSCR